jgi:hypothetical protein
MQIGSRIKVKLISVNKITPPMSEDTLAARCDMHSENEYQVAAEIVQIS